MTQSAPMSSAVGAVCEARETECRNPKAHIMGPVNWRAGGRIKEGDTTFTPPHFRRRCQNSLTWAGPHLPGRSSLKRPALFRRSSPRPAITMQSSWQRPHSESMSGGGFRIPHWGRGGSGSLTLGRHARTRMQSMYNSENQSSAPWVSGPAGTSEHVSLRRCVPLPGTEPITVTWRVDKAIITAPAGRQIRYELWHRMREACDHHGDIANPAARMRRVSWQSDWQLWGGLS